VTEYARRSARLILLDSDGRALMFCYRDQRYGRSWFTPGGGVDPGEGLREAAVRELFEETGLRVPVDELGPHVAFTTGYVALTWIEGQMRDDFFVHRSASSEIRLDGMLDYETNSLIEYRWLSADDVRACPDRVVPNGLADLIDRLAAGDVPAVPVELPWHE